MKLAVVERRYAVAFALTATLFFAWGQASQFNDLLLHHFQKALDLTRTQASLTQFAFYIGYFCAPLPAVMIIDAHQHFWNPGHVAPSGLAPLRQVKFYAQTASGFQVSS